jgi:[protein-PII] uridylyltransferase
VQFVRTVGTVDTLRMLLVLTAADTEAVAPGSLTSWKESLFVELYSRAMEELTGASPVADEQARVAAIREQLRHGLSPEFGSDWLDPQLAAMPLPYLLRCSPDVVASHLRAQKKLDATGVRVESEYLKDRGLSQFTVFTREAVTPGLFAKITGVLAAVGIQIVDAEIVTRSDGLVVDTFRGEDSDYRGEPPPRRLDEIARLLEQALLGKQSVEDLFAARHDGGASGPKQHSAWPTQVEIDNTTSERATILEVFADDRPGLLYSVARTLFELDISVVSAKISTRLDQVADVFYVTDRAGAKVINEARLEIIRKRLLEVISPGQPVAP